MSETLSNVFDAGAARRRCLTYRRRILDISQQVGALHIAPAFSCTEIVDVVYNGLMRWDGEDTPDVILMSKGHGCMIQYVILEEKGILLREDLDLYCKPGGRLGAHPDYGVPGISASTGSLGHGMGLATGMAYGERLQDRDGQIYLVLSDGECQEGSTWEGAMMAGNLALENLIAFVDLNDFSGLERMSEGHPAFHPVIDKFLSFGWEGVEVNGHSADEIHEAVMNREGGKPLVVVSKTVKGKGVSYMEHVPIWHYRAPSPEEYKQACDELVEISA
ncbi:MAG: transketolase [Alphaproteobacteria bacterium]|nr:transketolase [Alphaproteobacteria bacterium]